MTCAMCGYEWCWVCGLPFHSIFHYGQGGGAMCELIGTAAFSDRGCCCKYFCLFIILILLPVILVCIFFFFACVVTFLTFTEGSCHMLCRLTLGKAFGYWGSVSRYRIQKKTWKEQIVACPFFFFAYLFLTTWIIILICFWTAIAII